MLFTIIKLMQRLHSCFSQQRITAVAAVVVLHWKTKEGGKNLKITRDFGVSLQNHMENTHFTTKQKQ